MTQDMKKDTILHAITKQLVRNWRTPLRQVAHSIAFGSALTQKQYLSSDDILASLRWQVSRTRASSRVSLDSCVPSVASEQSSSDVSCLTTLRLVVLMFLMMVVGVSVSWGLTPKVANGVYYIKNSNGKWYLWPSVTTNSTTGNQYLTTYNNTSATAGEYNSVVYYPAFDNTYSHWVVKNIEGGYIQLISPRLNKYVVIRSFPKANNTKQNAYGDRDVWLADEPTTADIDYSYFVLNNNDSPYKISPKPELNSVIETSAYSLNSAAGNDRGWLTWTESNDKNYPRTGEGRQGLIQFFNGGTPTWSFTPDLLDAPIISDVDGSTNTVTITDANSLPAGYTIRYTTDGIAPTATTGTEYSGPMWVSANCTVKAVVVRYGIVLTEVATKSVTPVLASPVISFDNSTSLATITCATTGADVYYNTGDGSQTDPTTSTAPYSASFSVTTPTTVKAISRKGDLTSPVVTLSIAQVATPTIQDNSSNAISITSVTEGATIYYTTDSSTPTTGSTLYTGPLTEGYSGITIRAIAVKENMINSAVGSGSVTLQCATPVIMKATSTTFTISCSFPISGVSIYYTTDESTPTISSTPYGEAVSFDPNDLPFTVKAIAVASNYSVSDVAEQVLTKDLILGKDGYYEIASDDDYATFITMANTLGANGKYKITADVNASGIDAVTIPFTGELMGVAKTYGTFPVISNLGHPLFNTINGGVVKNIMLDKVSISQAGNVGAIAGEASGYTRIYNCGILPNDATNSSPSTVASTDGYCGGLVGWLKDDSRVVNCFSYAEITGGTDVAGIVGHNEFASTAEVDGDKYTKLKTAVVNCMFYGNISGGTNHYPVYGGEKIVNNTANGINNYDFYRAEASVGTLADYNCSWPAKEEYLTHYEFYRNLLNSNRELCGWWVGAPSAPSTMTTAEVQTVAKDASLMAKWVLDTNIAPYPILKKFGKYISPINIDADASWRETAGEWEGKKLGELNVTVESGSQSSLSDQSLKLIITDMDTLRADYCYRKVQLPYYNTVFGDPNGATWAAKYGGNYGDYVVIGWKVSTSEGTLGTFTEDWQDGYNFADRNCTAKDANRVFAQGGYYYVPNGVENITITAQWASAIYLDNTDRYYDRVSVSTFANTNINGVGNVDVGSANVSKFEPAGTRPTTLGNGKTVNSGTVSNTMPSNGSVYRNAIVLVGNHQEFVGASDIGSSSKGGTIMSADFDFDEEPDHCLIWQLGNKTDRQGFCPIRFDFLPIAELGLAMKEDGSTQYYSLGCYRPLGHFEVTETSLIHFGQFEFGHSGRSIDAPLILNGGILDQYTKGTKSKSTADDKIDYVIIGGNVRIPSFTPGAHVNSGAKYPTRHCAVNVIGGNIDYLYLTGNFNESVPPNNDNPHCYIDGGRIMQVAAAGKEGIAGDVTFKINHSKIWEFYGGSTVDLATGDYYKIVKGNIDVTIDNSIVDKYCGGPKFGNMVYDEANPENSKTITTNATNTIFGVYYGGGNGGTSYVQYDKTDGERRISDTFDWAGTGKLNSYTAGKYRSGNANYMADYNMEIVNTSTGTNSGTAIYRSYFYAAQFSATNTGPITNNLTDCKILTNFYGGGNLGGVKGDVTSKLMGTTHVDGSVFGAGYSASIPEVTIYNKNKTPPTINVYTGIITPTPDPDPTSTSTTYTWTNDNTLSTSNPKSSDGKYFFTEESLTNLGTITGNINLTIDGTTVVEGKVFKTDGTVDTTKKGGVYGGGDESVVDGDVLITIKGDATVNGNVFGGGNEGAVTGSTEVKIE